MRSIGYYLAVLALAGGLAACNKDKGPEGPTDFSGGCEAVDLGLGVKWASYNVGALNVDDRGSYFAWGETCEKSNYDWSLSVYESNPLSAYCFGFFSSGGKDWDGGFRYVGLSVRAVTEY